jgi:cystathionine beta-lyase/cystathionine gamma-synthase
MPTYTVGRSDCSNAFSRVRSGARVHRRPSPPAFKKLTDAKTKLVWIESPTNPLLRCLDIAAIAKIAHDAGAKLAVDNTFATPALQLPLKLGADYAVHSTTKYIGGHSDVIGGAIVVKDAALMERIAFLQNALGGVPGPFDCFLQHRGIKTLSLRMERHSANALALSKHLRGHAKLTKVIYPFLEDHPDLALAKKQMCGGGGIVTSPKGNAPRRFCESTALQRPIAGGVSRWNHPPS